MTVRASPKDAKGALVELTHLADDGTRVAAPFLDNQMGAVPLREGRRAELLVLRLRAVEDPAVKSTYDFDHDGVPEAWVQQIPDDSFAVEGDALFTLRAGKIAPYAPRPASPRSSSRTSTTTASRTCLPAAARRWLRRGGARRCARPTRPPRGAREGGRNVLVRRRRGEEGRARRLPAPPAEPASSRRCRRVLRARVGRPHEGPPAPPAREGRVPPRAPDPGKPGEGCTPVGKSACRRSPTSATSPASSRGSR